MKRLTFLQLNELNFEILQRYIETGEDFPAFQRLLKIGIKRTSSEERYEELEPWIQWPSAYTGLVYAEHKLFHLGDGSSSDLPTIFEQLSDEGISVSAVSPMNIALRSDSIEVFVPDPWTKSVTDGSWQSRFLHSAIVRLVNENASSGVSNLALAKLALVSFVALSPFKLVVLLKQAIKARGSRTLKAMFFDRLLYEISSSRARKLSTQFHSVFLNGVAHVQHHYFKDCTVANVDRKNPEWYRDNIPDPILTSYKVYDEIVSDALSRGDSVLIATGLSQTIYPKPEYYYRLRDPKNFLSILGIPFLRVLPRMSRDFSVEFHNENQAQFCQERFMGVSLRGCRLFKDMDLSGSKLFVSLTFNDEIGVRDTLDPPFDGITIGSLVDFVAIKNGHHVPTGYLLSSNRQLLELFSDESHVANIANVIKCFFAIRK